MVGHAGRWAGAGHLLIVTVVLLLLAVMPAQAEQHAANGTVDVAEVEPTAGVSPSGAAGLTLLGAAVLATLWSVAVGERRARARPTE